MEGPARVRSERELERERDSERERERVGGEGERECVEGTGNGIPRRLGDVPLVER